jgi:hypothetical protein
MSSCPVKGRHSSASADTECEWCHPTICACGCGDPIDPDEDFIIDDEGHRFREDCWNP